MAHVATGQFTGMITSFRNQTIMVGLRPVVNLLTEIVGNDEFKNRSGTDDSTKAHMTQLIADCDKSRRLITYNPDNLDLKAVAPELIDTKQAQKASLNPINLDGIQLSSTPEVELMWRFDGTDVNLPLWEKLEFRNGIGGILYGAASAVAVNYTRLESRNRSYMITVNDSLRMYSYMQTFRDLCDNLLGKDNQVDIAQPLATDEPANVSAPNRVGEATVVIGTSLQNAPTPGN
jgi:hypothetical protein